MKATNRWIKYGALALIVCFIGAGLGAVVKEYYHPQSATGASVILARYLDDTLLAEDEEIPWGYVENSTSYLYDLDVQNIGNIEVTVTLIIQGLPVGWSETWTADGSTLSPDGWANGTLTLTTDGSVVSGQSYNWDSWVLGEQT